jgi:Fic family protein
MDIMTDKKSDMNLFGNPAERPYEASHPWLRFKVDLRAASPRLWSLLGECQSKCEHLAGVPLRPDTARELTQVYLAKGVLASAAIEGNTLTEQEALAHVKGNLTTPPSRKYLQQEIDNLLKLLNQVAKDVLGGKINRLSREAIKEFNRRILDGLDVENHVIPGEIPTVNIGVGRYPGAPRVDCDYLLDKLCDWLNEDWSAPGTLEHICAAIIKAVVAHLYLVWIHPFGDGNGRTARMMEVQILLQSGIPQPSCQLLSNHYNKTREKYYRELQRASESGGDIVPFLIYAIEGFRDGLKEQIERIRLQQWEVSWRNYVHEEFKDSDSAGERRKRLVLDLDRSENPVPKSKIREISARVATKYANLDEKTLLRDLAWLEQRQFIRLEPDGYVSNRELILAFLPHCVAIGNRENQSS